MHLTIKTIIRLADWHLRLCSSASFMLLSAVIFLWPVNASGEETVGSSTSLVEPVYSCESSGYQKPYVSFNGSQVLYTEGAQVTGRDPKTGLVRWQGGNLKHVRRVLDFAKTVLLVGEHLQMVEKEWGKQAWDFPLNCFPNECNADVLAITGTQALVGGFGTVFNMVNLINLETGKEVWPSWLTACKYRTAAIISDSVILACKSPGPLLQRIDISSRRTLFTAPRPDPGFTPSQLWASSRYLFVDGTLAGKRKLYIFATEDGSIVRKFNVKSGGDEMGFMVSPEQGRFVPWQRKGSKLLLWGIDAGTGKVAWQKKWAGGQIVGQLGAILIVKISANLAPDTATTRATAVVYITGIDLATGKALYNHRFHGKTMTPIMQDNSVLAVQPDGLFVVFSGLEGTVHQFGRLEDASGINPDKFSFRALGKDFLVLNGNKVILHQQVPLADRTSILLEHLDQGNEEQADAEYRRLAPFRSVLPSLDRIHNEMLRYQWLMAELALREGDPDEALRRAQPGIAEIQPPAQQEMRKWFSQISRFALECALLPSQEEEVDEFLLTLLGTLRQHAMADGFLLAGTDPGPAQLVNLAVSIATSIDHERLAADAFSELRTLHSHSALKGFFEGHPFWIQFLVAEIETTLAAADEALKIEESALASDLLYDLVKVSLATQLFGSTYEPWLDAQGVRLLPEEMQASKLAEIIPALMKKLTQSRSRVLADSGHQVCSRSCNLAEQYCRGTCIETLQCTKAATRCKASCKRDKTVWIPPDFTAEPGTTGFYQCR